MFNSKNIFTFFEYKNKINSINLLFKKKLLYRFLYFLFTKKPDILQNYFLKNLILDRICKSINFVEISILFVLKSNSNFKLYIDYYNLNIITIKNKYFLFFIKETLDYLIDIAYFTKLNLKTLTIKSIFIKKTNRRQSFRYNIFTSSIQYYYLS